MTEAWLSWYARNRERILEKRRLAYVANRTALLQEMKIYYEANRERILTEKRAQYYLNLEENRAVARVYEAANRARRSALHKAWLAAHPEQTREYDRKRHAKNPFPRRLASRKRKAVIRGNTIGPIDYRELIALSGGKCGICGKRVAAAERSFDHIVPLSRGGAHAQHNLRLTHLACNLRRGNRTSAQPYLPM